MTGFKLTQDGDIELYGGDIALVDGVKLEQQTIRTVLQTNKGEWYFNTDEGIDFYAILGKGNTEDMARSQVINGVHQVNPNRNIEDFTYKTNGRTAVIDFTAKEQGGSDIALEAEY